MTRYQHHHPRRRWRVQAMTAATIALLATTSACTGGGEEPEPLPPETSATSTPTETPTPETDAEKAEAVVEHFLEVRDEAYRTLTVTKELNKVATDSAHATLQTEVQNFREVAIKISGDYQHSLSPAEKRSATSYDVVDCEDSSKSPYIQRGKPVQRSAPDGSPLVNPRPTRYRVEFTRHPGLPNSADRWLVTEILWMGNRQC